MRAVLRVSVCSVEGSGEGSREDTFGGEVEEGEREDMVLGEGGGRRQVWWWLYWIGGLKEGGEVESM